MNGWLFKLSLGSRSLHHRYGLICFWRHGHFLLENRKGLTLGPDQLVFLFEIFEQLVEVQSDWSMLITGRVACWPIRLQRLLRAPLRLRIHYRASRFSERQLFLTFQFLGRTWMAINCLHPFSKKHCTELNKKSEHLQFILNKLLCPVLVSLQSMWKPRRM